MAGQISFNVTDEVIETVKRTAARLQISEEEACSRIFSFGIRCSANILEGNSQLWLLHNGQKFRVDTQL